MVTVKFKFKVLRGRDRETIGLSTSPGEILGLDLDLWLCFRYNKGIIAV
jgi:hypothetical protein